MLAEKDCAKYPFTAEALDLVGNLQFKLKEFSSDELPIIERAAQRIRESAVKPVKTLHAQEELTKLSKTHNLKVEILSFPIAMVMMKAIEDSYCQRRFALYEAKRVSALLAEEDDKKLAEIAKGNFGWKITVQKPGSMKLGFNDYLRNAAGMQEDVWKLVNRDLEYGEVYTSKAEAARLLEEEVRRRILSRLEFGPSLELPEPVAKMVATLKEELADLKKELPSEEALGEVDARAFPPCIAYTYSELRSGRNISHMGRFTLTAFLLHAGMEPNDVTKLYMAATDFDEDLTKYQVDHIAGAIGGRVRYTPLSCLSMQTHRLCHQPNFLCSKVKHPLQYYKRKKKALRLESSAEAKETKPSR